MNVRKGLKEGFEEPPSFELKNWTKRELATKRIGDILLGTVGTLFFILFTLIFYVPYQLGENKGPMLYRQKRYGLHGKFIYIYKFRSMRVNADEILKGNQKLYEKYVENGYKLPVDEDPRITKLGKFIRKTSIDEFPQFINVLRGDLAIIGPRPIVEEEIKEYAGKEALFFSMKPGISGVWTTSGRSNVNYPERADMELSYATKHSTTKDFEILYRTIVKVIEEDGAI